MRTLAPELEAALNNGQFTAYFNVIISDADGEIFNGQPSYFEITPTTAKVKYINQTMDVFEPYGHPEYIKVIITRGVTISGINYTISTSDLFATKGSWDGSFQELECALFPELYLIIAGDDTYENIITAVCAKYGKTAVFKDPAAAWLNYQFLPSGKQLILSKANSFFNILRQKYIIEACDNGNNEILFGSVNADPPPAEQYTINVNRWSLTYAQYYRRFLSRDETGSTTYSGGTNDPIWNLGFLESTASHPSTKFSYQKWVFAPLAPHLKYQPLDAVSLSITEPTVFTQRIHAHFIEIFDPKLKEIPWRSVISNYAWAEGGEGGSLPSTIERVAAYTPLVSTGFDGNLTPAVNNLQALAQAVDDMTVIGSSATWGDITGTLAAQSDLNSALAGKAASIHSHLEIMTSDPTVSISGKDFAYNSTSGSLFLWNGTAWITVGAGTITPTTDYYFLLENGSFLLLENGNKLILG